MLPLNLCIVLFLINYSDTDKSHQKATGTGFMAPLQMSEALVKFLGTGESTISRSDAVKRIWDYIKQNQLQVRCLS